MTTVARCATVLAGLAIALGVSAAPYLPTDDAQVLERLPSRSTPQFRELRLRQAEAAKSPRDLPAALALATAYIRASRVEGDPRFLGYAQATLGPWWADPAAPTAVLVLRATILQSRHEFDAAVADLDRVLQRDPRHAQALLTRATILTVQGKYAAARADCERLVGLVPPTYPVICRSSIDSVTGTAAAAYDAVQRALATSPRVDATQRVWGQTLLGEIAHRRGDRAASAHFLAALAIDGKDLYLLAAYSDWLLDQGRARDVIALLETETRIDPLLLRLALAQKALQRPEAAASIATLQARFDASRTRGDTVHQRENARFELFLRADPGAAIALARNDWTVQREPADVRILAEAAVAAEDAAALDVVKKWIAETGFDDAAVTALVRGQAMPR
jgi:tetratricopeptide (TPR) repeat protein